MIVDNLVQTVVERSIEEALRMAVVSEGYLPDVTSFNTAAAYNTAINQIVSTKGFAIEVFGNSTNEAKGLKRVPRITIESGKTVPGDLGFGFNPIIGPNPDGTGNFAKYQTPFTSADFQFEIHLVVASTVQHRVVHAIWNKAIGHLRFLQIYNDATQRFLIELYGFYDQPDMPEGIYEAVYNHQVKDLYAFDGIKIADIAKITSIILEITTSGQSQYPGGTSSDNIMVNPAQFKNNPYIHTGNPTSSIHWLGVSTASFIAITWGDTPYFLYTGNNSIPERHFKIEPNDMIALDHPITAGEILSITTQS